ncbi:GlsB/YeaQ/YmgE family stress response membrane protein [Plantactinospora sp. CA-290183]|uniref:GlsB/YeaQ/YmgE family stress response membrane protein n=1 Tax=Plantactinospora sp. CA-290183 TaxID=3240006 RepID=UPI003D8A293F
MTEPTTPTTPTEPNEPDAPTAPNAADAATTPAAPTSPPNPDGGGIPLERRYRRLLRAYPAGYRAGRGEEIVGTYLDLVDPQRRWPSAEDAFDMLRAGLRQRLREYGALGLAAGLPTAATIALGTLMALAAFLLPQVEFANPRFARVESVGPVQTLGALIWAGWLLVGLVAAALPGRWARRTAAGTVLLTLLLPPVSALTGLPRPPLFVLVPALALGLTALALPADPGWIQRITPLLGAGVGVAVSEGFRYAQGSGRWFTSYLSTPETLAMAGGPVVALALVVGIGRALRGDDSGLWATLLLMTPAGLLCVEPLARGSWGARGGGPTWWMYAATAALVVLAGAAVLAAAIAGRAVRHRAVRRRTHSHPCPTCGQHTMTPPPPVAG